MTKKEFDQLLNKGSFSAKELHILEPYKVSRAVIMAAGLGSRLRPLTYSIAKPLIKVNGIRMIDTIIDALKVNGIHEIYIICGYHADQFGVLLEKYPDLHLLNNAFYDQGNNILSACLAGNLLAGAYMMPADLYIRNAGILPRFQYASNVLGYPVDETDDWCMETDKEGVVCRLSLGGTKCYKDTGIFFWNAMDGLQLSRDIAKVCMTNEGRQRYWSNVAFEIYRQHYRAYIRVCKKSDVVEIDTLKELQEMDASYREGIV